MPRAVKWEEKKVPVSFSMNHREIAQYDALVERWGLKNRSDLVRKVLSEVCERELNDAETE